MRMPPLPQKITKQGITATIRRVSKAGYDSFRVEYVVKGKRQQVWRAKYEDARKVVDEALQSIADGDHGVIQLRDAERLGYQRAVEILKPMGVAIDVAARDYVEAMGLLGGRASLNEVCRHWLKVHTVGLTKRTVPDAVNELIVQIQTEQRNTTGGARRKDAWAKLLRAHLQGKLARDFNCQVSELSSMLLEPWLVGLKGSERTRANIRDCVAFFFKWAKGRNYLAKDADPLANVLKFRKRKRGAVMTITAEELAKLFRQAHNNTRLSPLTSFSPFLSLGL
jgi:hypothetical protein